MYHLVYFKATNLIGFMQGLGKKTFELDLHEYSNRNIFCILGDNGTGKSTFQSLIHPWYQPSDKRNKFVINQKEGTLLREYENDDGTAILTKCVYTPKGNDAHTTRCFFKVVYPNGEETELNPNGNVGSYESLLYTYFGITKDFIRFASYNQDLSGIVSMTDTERKNSISTMVPNTSRFDVSYGIINDKYKELRNLIRNLSQKILSIRDEDSLRSDLERLTKDLNKFTEERESAIKKLAKADGRLKELTHGKDLREIITSYNDLLNSMLTYNSKIDHIFKELMKLYKKLGIQPDENSITFDGIDTIDQSIIRLEKKLAKAESNSANQEVQLHRFKSELFKTQKDIMENESVLFSVQTQDVNELEQTKANYLQQISSMRYASMIKECENMNYSDVTNLARIVSIMDSMIYALYEEYGNLVTVYFEEMRVNHDQFSSLTKSEVTRLTGSIETFNAKKDRIYRQLIEKEQYRKFQDILSQRPLTCKIDTCPFISNALKWAKIADEISTLKTEFQQLDVELRAEQESLSKQENLLKIHEDMQKLISYVDSYKSQLKLYLNITPEILYDGIEHGSWNSLFDVIKLKSIASILSEKELYQNIVNQKIPEIDHAIEVAKLYGRNRDMLQHQLNRLHESQDLLTAEIKSIQHKQKINDDVKGIYETKLLYWRRVQELITQYKEFVTARITAHETAETQGDQIEIIQELHDKSKELKRRIDDLSSMITERIPMRERMKIDLETLNNLKTEKAVMERDFVLVDIMRTISQPGKGVRKELIDIYMHDIRQITNQLLSGTFNGNLYLDKFKIDDKQFTMPFVFNGSEGSDVSYASGAQKSTITSAFSLAIISKLIDKYGILTFDELDGPLSTINKEAFIDIFIKQMRYIGICQSFIITHSPENYESYDCVFICFPGYKLNGSDKDVIKVNE